MQYIILYLKLFNTVLIRISPPFRYLPSCFLAFAGIYGVWPSVVSILLFIFVRYFGAPE